MQQDNNIINKLKELEKQQLPDLSQMENHWQQMEAVLPAANATVAKVININRWIWIVTSAFLIIVGILFFNNLKNKKQGETIASETNASKTASTNNSIIPSGNNATVIDTPKPASNIMGVIDTTVKQASFKKTFTGVEEKIKQL